jgi:hypothetical protein
MPARRRQVSRTVFNEIFLVLDTIFCRKSLELTKNHQKLLTKSLNLFKFRGKEQLYIGVFALRHLDGKV